MNVDIDDFSFQMSNEPAFVVNESLEVVVWNTAMENITHYPHEQAVGRTLSSIPNKFFDEDFVAKVIRALNGKGGVTTYPLSFDGFQRFICSYTPILSESASKFKCMVLFHPLEEDVVDDEYSRYKPIVRESPIPTAIYRPDGTPKYFNRTYRNIWGASGDTGKLMLKSKYNILCDEQFEELGLMPFIEKGFRGETSSIPPVSYNPSRTAALAEFGLDVNKHIKGHIFPVKNRFGVIEEVALVLLDITFQMQAEEILTDNHLKFQMLTMGLPGVIYEYEFKNEKPHFKYISQGCNEMFGYSPEEILSRPKIMHDMVHPDDVLNFNITSDDAARKGSQWEWQGRFLVEGKTKWIEGRSNTAGSDKNIRYGMLLDVTERKLAEQQSRHNDRLFTQLFKNSPFGIVLLDHNYNVIQLNQGFTDIFGYSHNDIVGKELNKIIVPEGYEEQALDVNLMTAKDEVCVIESFRKHRNGTLVPVIIYGVSVSLNNETIGIYGIYVNITDLKHVEQELQIRNEELDNFVYKVSHDLRAPLSSILGLINVTRIESSQEELRRYINLIENRIQQLDSFINDVLSHSKNLKLELEASKIDFEKIIYGCFQDLSYMPWMEKVHRKINIGPNDFYSDRWRISEIFRNLISNAVKYLDPKKDQPIIRIDVQSKDSDLILTIEDNGIGIADATLPKIFDMFYRATAHSEGSGIGLYIVRNAIDKLGGRIDISSVLGEGTTFRIVLPNMK